MEDRELLQEKDYEISIQSSGKSREEVYQNLFKQLRNDIHSSIEGYLVEMHVESMRLVHEEIEKFTKKFFIFLSACGAYSFHSNSGFQS